MSSNDQPTNQSRNQPRSPNATPTPSSRSPVQYPIISGRQVTPQQIEQARQRAKEKGYMGGER